MNPWRWIHSFIWSSFYPFPNVPCIKLFDLLHMQHIKFSKSLFSAKLFSVRFLKHTIFFCHNQFFTLHFISGISLFSFTFPSKVDTPNTQWSISKQNHKPRYRHLINFMCLWYVVLCCLQTPKVDMIIHLINHSNVTGIKFVTSAYFVILLWTKVKIYYCLD